GPSQEATSVDFEGASDLVVKASGGQSDIQPACAGSGPAACVCRHCASPGLSFPTKIASSSTSSIHF
ncbi:hypothetical protein LINPERPRIM_LOCUS1424, partial [Linum perenne]